MSSTLTKKVVLGTKASAYSTPITISKDTSIVSNPPSPSIRIVQKTTTGNSVRGCTHIDFATKSKRDTYRKINNILGEG